MSQKKNILWIMADQLRFDYLSCYGHPTLKTPVMDSLAERGVRFDNAYVNATICGPSRMSYYTGRYVSSHGSTWNGVPLRVGEMTLGDHLRPLGYRVALVGKTHMKMDVEGFKRLGLNKESIEGVYASEAGFEPYLRDDGIHPDMMVNPELEYNQYLREQGYDSPNPWHFGANAGKDQEGDSLSGWYLRNAGEPTVVPDEHSETAFMTNRAMDFIREAGDEPWCLHLSYIKPHWPYIASAPYHNMYSAEDVIPVVRCEEERENPHPIYAAYMKYIEGESFSEDKVRETVIPVYMGLIKQLDDHLGRLINFLDEQGLKENTVIVISSDHGDYLGDHWLGEKELFHDPSAKVPLIIVDPSKESDATRGTASDELVQAIDLAATFTDMAGGTEFDHVLEGKSLKPLLEGHGHGHDFIISEVDYGHRGVSGWMNRPYDRCKAYMVLTKDWKYIHWEDLDPQLYDRRNDPNEFVDLGTHPDYQQVREQHEAILFDWFRHRSMTVTYPKTRVEEMKARFKDGLKGPVKIGQW